MGVDGQRDASATLPPELVLRGAENHALLLGFSPQNVQPIASHHTGHTIPATPHFSDADRPVYN